VLPDHEAAVARVLALCDENPNGNDYYVGDMLDIASVRHAVFGEPCEKFKPSRHETHEPPYPGYTCDRCGFAFVGHRP
jgi:hypothetical protein